MPGSAPLYTRAATRPGQLAVSTKFYQALGAMPDAFKSFAFNTFLLLYYNQVLGLNASWVSAVLTLSIIIDAITDPLVGSFSDTLRTRLGRRHPLMYAAIVPLGICLYCVFRPPENAGPALLLAWLAMFAVMTRVAMTFYLIPWSAMFAELSDNYAERSEVLTWRYLVGGVGTVVFTVSVWTLMFPSSAAFPQGQLNPAGYPSFAGVLAASVMTFAFLTTFLTQREIPFLRQPVGKQAFGIAETLGDLKAALANPEFRILFVGLLVSSAITGTLAALEIYVQTFFWGLTSEDLRWFSIAGIGGLAAFAVIPGLQRRYDKKALLLIVMIINLAATTALFALRFALILPAAGDPLLVKLLIAFGVFQVFCGFIIGVMFISMIADTIDFQELRTGKRQEGIFSAAISFSNKAISGFGILAAGLLLEGVVRFPEGASRTTLAADVVVRLGVTVTAIALLYLIPFWMIRNYRITRSEHARITRALAERTGS